MAVNTAPVPTPSPPPRTGFGFLDTVLEPAGSVIAMAHRGGAGHPDLIGLENTRAAFRHAVDLGYGYLETDVHATRDGVLVAFHDDVLDRVTDRTGAIRTLRADELGLARIAGRHPIPTLAELFEEFPGVRFNIDVKSDGAVYPLVALLDRFAAHDRVCVGSFGQRRMSLFRLLTRGRVATSATPLEVAAFRSAPSAGAARLATRTGAGGPVALQIPHRRGRLVVATPGLVRRAHAAGAQVHVWTVDEPAEMHALLDRGVDGLITDRTDLLREVLEARGQWRDTP